MICGYSWCGVLSSVQAEKDDDATTVAAAMGVLRRLHGDAIPEPTAAHVSRWGSDPYSRGAPAAACKLTMQLLQFWQYMATSESVVPVSQLKSQRQDSMKAVDKGVQEAEGVVCPIILHAVV